MSKEIANPLAALVAAAKKSLPQTTGATAKAQAERDRPQRHMILADVSGSMAEPAGGRRKIDVLRSALASAASGAEIVAFSRDVRPVQGAELPEPSGGTALHLALDYASRAGATSVLVISDGHPDSEAVALASAGKISRIDGIYCGPENDHAGLAFMRRLARGGGAAHHRSLANQQQLTAAVRQLALPPR